MKTNGCIKYLAALFVVFALLVGGLAVYRVTSGKSLGLKAWAIHQVNSTIDRIQVLINAPSRERTSTGEFTDVIFLHHSVGQNLIEQGDLRKLFTQAGYQFWDHDYNLIGLTDPAGQRTGYSYTIPKDNTDPDGLYTVFRQREYPLPINAFSGLMQHEVIIFKSCFPASNIPSDEELEARKQMYLEIRNVMDSHPEKLFVVVTQPPLNPAETNPENAARARAFADWLMSEDFLAGHPNMVGYNLFDQLAEESTDAPDANMLKEQYRQGSDSHPNSLANQTIAADFVSSVVEAIENYQTNFAANTSND